MSERRDEGETGRSEDAGLGTSSPQQEPATGSGEKEDEKVPLLEMLKLLAKAPRAFWAVNLINFGDGVTYFGVLALLSLYLDLEIGMGTEWSTRSVSGFTGLVTIGMFLGGGIVSDRLGVRRALTLVLVLLAVGRLLLFSAPWMGPHVLVIIVAVLSLVLMGIGEAIIQPALYAGVKEYSDERTRTMGYAFIYAIMNLGIAAVEGVSPYIRAFTRKLEGTEGVPTGGITGVYVVMFGLTLLMLLAHLLLFTRKVEETQRMVDPDADDTSEDEDPRSLREKLADLPILDKRFLFFIFILLPVRTLFAHQFLTIPHYIARCYPDWVTESLEHINMINPLIIVIFVPLIAAFTRNVSIVTMMIIGTFISALSTGLLLPEPSLTLLVVYVVVWSLGEAVWSSRFLEYVAQLAPAGRVGTYMGIATVPWFLAKFTTGFYAGNVIDYFIPEHGPQHPGMMWALYGAIALISPIGLLLAKRWVESGVRQGDA